MPGGAFWLWSSAHSTLGTSVTMNKCQVGWRSPSVRNVAYGFDRELYTKLQNAPILAPQTGVDNSITTWHSMPYHAVMECDDARTGGSGEDSREPPQGHSRGSTSQETGYMAGAMPFLFCRGGRAVYHLHRWASGKAQRPASIHSLNTEGEMTMTGLRKRTTAERS